MSERKVLIVGSFALEVTVDDAAPADVLSRASQPGFPYWQRNGEPLTRSQTVDHLAHNAVTNGVTDLAQLDGWADLERGVTSMRVTEVTVDRWIAEGLA